MRDLTITTSESIDGLHLSLSFSASEQALMMQEISEPCEHESNCMPYDLLQKVREAVHQEISQTLLSLHPRLAESLKAVTTSYLQIKLLTTEE